MMGSMEIEKPIRRRRTRPEGALIRIQSGAPIFNDSGHLVWPFSFQVDSCARSRGGLAFKGQPKPETGSLAGRATYVQLASMFFDDDVVGD